MASDRTYTELEVLAIMVTMRDLHRTYPNAHYTIDRDLTGRIIGWKIAGPPREPAAAQDIDWRLPPDHGITTGHQPPGDSSGVFTGGYGLWLVMAWLLLLLAAAAVSLLRAVTS